MTVERAGNSCILACLDTSEAGSDRRVPVSVTPPFAAGIYYSYTDTLRLELLASSTLEDAIAISAFRPLYPGITTAGAAKLLGTPLRVERDMFKEPWHFWSLERLEAKVGCWYSCSGDTPSECRWALEGRVPKPAELLTPVIDAPPLLTLPSNWVVLANTS